MTIREAASSGGSGAGPDAADATGAADAPEAVDAVEHLWAAAHELLQAARTVIDAADAVVLEQQQRAADRRQGASGPPRLRRIDIG